MRLKHDMTTGFIAMANVQTSMRWRRFIAPLVAVALLAAGYAIGLAQLFTLCNRSPKTGLHWQTTHPAI